MRANAPLNASANANARSPRPAVVSAADVPMVKSRLLIILVILMARLQMPALQGQIAA
jgi:hypothetical protein